MDEYDVIVLGTGAAGLTAALAADAGGARGQLAGAGAGASFDYQRQLFHVGVRVPDLKAAMVALEQGLGVTWSAVVEREQQIWSPDGGASTIPLRFTYSAEGPQHIELLQGAAGSVWDGNDLPGVHHLGVWVDDVASQTERLVGLGWTLELAHRPPTDGYGAFSYVRSPSGFLLEPVSVAARPRFERWWSGEPLS